MSNQTTSSTRIHETQPALATTSPEDFLGRLRASPLSVCTSEATDAWHAYLQGDLSGCASALTTLGTLLAQPEATSAATLIRRTSPGVFQELALSAR